jgi:hypothetical protein
MGYILREPPVTPGGFLFVRPAGRLCNFDSCQIQPLSDQDPFSVPGQNQDQRDRAPGKNLSKHFPLYLIEL